MTDRTVSVDLTIRTPVAGTRVQYQFCSPAATPVYFAYQDGTGAWQTATGAQQGNAFEYAFDIASGRGGVAMVFAAPGSANIVRDKLVLRRSQVGSPMQAAARRTRLNGYETVVQYGTTSELADDGIEMCAVTRPTKTVSVLIAGIPQGSYGILSYGNTTRIFNPAEATEPAVTFDDAVTGVSDFVATRTTPQNPPDRIILLRDLNVPDGGMLPAIDFNAAGTLTPATAQVTVTGSLNDPLEAFVDLVTANSYEGLWMELASSPATVRTWAGLSQQDMRSSDFHALIVFASAQNESGDFRVTQRFVDYVTNQTLAMGPLMSLPGISQLPSGTRLRFQGVLPGEYDRGLAFTVADTSGLGNSYFMTATTGYLAASGGAFQYNLAMPDLTALAGFPFASLLGAGDYDVAMDAYGFNGPGAFGPRPVRGGEFRAAVRNTSITIN